ncbi:hypothetical protein MJO28_017027 [Puccinia striiformis f. sp. tritici]|nr:hypothetical protein MJO28_017027 [Puccinia striiformis f. sp. tritici]
MKLTCIGGVGLVELRRPFTQLMESQDGVKAAVVMNTRKWVGLTLILSTLTEYKNPQQSPKFQSTTTNQRIITPILAILFTSHSALAATTPTPTSRTCDGYFYLSGKRGEAIIRGHTHASSIVAKWITNPVSNDFNRVMCCEVASSLITSCFYPVIFTWSLATFTNCDFLDKKTGQVNGGLGKEFIIPLQYHNQGDRWWYICASKATDKFNDHRAGESLPA